MELLCAVIGYLVVCISICGTHAASYTARYFMYSTTAVSWNTAYATCSLMRGHLITVDNNVTISALKYIRAQPEAAAVSNNIWMGLYNAAPTSVVPVYVWADCKHLNSSNIMWFPGEPNSVQTDLCIITSPEYEWKTRNCIENNAFFCEIVTNVDCTFEKETGQKCEIGGERLSETMTEDACATRCQEDMDGSDVCWAYEYNIILRECNLLFGSDPYICETLQENGSFITGRRRCFKFSDITGSEVAGPVDSFPGCSTTEVTTSTETPATTPTTTATRTITVPATTSAVTTTSTTPSTTVMISPLETTTTTATTTTIPTATSAVTTLNPTSMPETTADTTVAPIYSETSATSIATTQDAKTTAETTLETASSASDSAVMSSVTPTVTTTTASSPMAEVTSTITATRDTDTPTSTPVSSTTAPSSNATGTSFSTTLDTFLSRLEAAQASSRSASTPTVTSPGRYVYEVCVEVQTFTVAERKRRTDDIVTDLTLDKKNLSSYRRKKSSAEDERPSAQNVGGGVAIMLLVTAALIIILPDCSSILMDVVHVHKRKQLVQAQQ